MMFGLGTKAWSAIAGAVVVLGAVFAGVALADGDDFDPVYAPQWEPGYSFSYDVVADFAAISDGDSFQQLGVPDNTELTIGPIPVKKEVLSTSYRDADGQPVYVSAANVPLSSIQGGGFFGDFGSAPAFATAERQSDLAPVPVMPDMSCRSDDCTSGGLDFFASNPVTYLNFPLTPEKRWEQEVDLGFPLPLEELQGIDRMHVVGEVIGKESVELGGDLGSTEAIRVDFAYTPVGFQQWLSDFATTLEEMGFELERYTIQLGMHEIVHYSEDYEAIVKQQYLIHALVDVAVTGEIYGEEIDEEIYAEVDAVIDATLTGAEHPKGLADKTPTQILAMVGNPDLIHDATGQSATTKLVPYTVSLFSDDIQPNVAEGESSVFGVELSGVDELPDGHSLSYEVTAGDGSVVASGPASEGFLVHPDEPGIYEVTVSAINSDGGLVSASSQMLYADFDGVVEGDCMLSILAGAECSTEELRVAEGIDSLVIEAHTNSGLPSLSSTLRLYDAEGDLVDQDYDHIQVDDFSEFVLGDWSADFSSIGDASTDAEFYVTLDYEPMAVVDYDETSQEAEPSGGCSGCDGMAGLLSAIDTELGLLRS